MHLEKRRKGKKTGRNNLDRMMKNANENKILQIPQSSLSRALSYAHVGK
jgi:hypothetical protein